MQEKKKENHRKMVSRNGQYAKGYQRLARCFRCSDELKIGMGGWQNFVNITMHSRLVLFPISNFQMTV